MNCLAWLRCKSVGFRTYQFCSQVLTVLCSICGLVPSSERLEVLVFCAALDTISITAFIHVLEGDSSKSFWLVTLYVLKVAMHRVTMVTYITESYERCHIHYILSYIFYIALLFWIKLHYHCTIITALEKAAMSARYPHTAYHKKQICYKFQFHLYMCILS